MGTSASQRSPSTPEWDRVRELYQQPQPPPTEVVSRIVAALDPDSRQGLHDRAVTVCLDTLLWGSVSVAERGLEPLLATLGPLREPPVLVLAAGLRDHATDYVTARQAASRFGDLAIDALSNTVFGVTAGEQGLFTVTESRSRPTTVAGRAKGTCPGSRPSSSPTISIGSSGILSPAT